MAVDSISQIFQREWGRTVASLIRYCGNFDLAEDAVQDAFVIACDAWVDNGIPANPGGWIATTARRRLIDRLRREAARDAKEALVSVVQEMPSDPAEAEDDRLRLIFTCCHPALGLDARVALTLRTVCGLSTEEIAETFLVPVATMGQRISRAKRKIVVAGIPYVVPEPIELPGRLSAVLAVFYLIFNTGYNAVVRPTADDEGRSAEAIRLTRLLTVLVPNEPEIIGLLALMLLNQARRSTRTDSSGEIVLLGDQDRSKWDWALIGEGLSLVERAPQLGSVGQYWLQAAIVVEHVAPSTGEDRDWRRICSLYDRLVQQTGGSVVVQLNRAIAVSMLHGPEVALALLEPFRERLDGYVYFHSAEADFLARSGRRVAATAAYRRAIELTDNESQRRSLTRALENLDGSRELSKRTHARS